MSIRSANLLVSEILNLLPIIIENADFDPKIATANLSNLKTKVSLLEITDSQPITEKINKCLLTISQIEKRITTDIPLLEDISCTDATRSTDAKSLAIQQIRAGNFTSAISLIKTHRITLSDFAPNISPVLLKWILLNLSTFPDSSAALDILALPSRGREICFGYGYKSSNLLMMQIHAEEISKDCTASRVAVPDFLPISHYEIDCFIKSIYPRLDSDWTEFQMMLSTDLLLNKDALKILEKIRENIHKCFTDNIYENPELNLWLEEHPSLLIIRSTGIEDSDTHSNAGGNHTEPLVPPHISTVCLAISKVITSYFSEKSIRQRYANRDPSLLSDKPFLPVLIQTMISELPKPITAFDATSSDTSYGWILRSGVMFSWSSELGITVICTGLGSNEGIVTSRVPTDDYLIGFNQHIRKVIRNKERRVAPVLLEDGKIEYQMIRLSDQNFNRAPALSDDLVRDLRRVGDYFSMRVYGSTESPKALDIEYTIVNQPGSDKPLIGLLQVRPLVSHCQEIAIDYIDPNYISTLTINSKVIGKTLLDGNSYTRNSISSTFLICNDIEEAESEFIKLAQHEIAHIKTVIIRKPAPGTSHQAVNFRKNGIGILIVESAAEFLKIQTWARERKKISVDFQQGIVIQDEHPVINPGYVCYPLPLEYSIRPSDMILNLYELHTLPPDTDRSSLINRCKRETEQFKTHYNDLILQLRGSTDFEPVTATNPLKACIQKCLKTMSTGTEESAKSAGGELLCYLQLVLKKQKPLKSLGTEQLLLLMIVSEIALIIENQFLTVSQSPPQSLSRLYPVRLIESCLFQSSDIVGGFSLYEVLKKIKNQGKILRILDIDLSDTIASEKALRKSIFVKAGISLINFDDQIKFNSIIQKIDEINPATMTKLQKFFEQLSSLNILAEWMNSEFLDLLIANPDPVKLISILASITSKELETCIQHAEQVKKFRESISLWQSASYVEDNGAKLCFALKEIGFTIINTDPKSIYQRYRSASRLEKLAILQTTREVVTVFDEIIKTVKASPHYKSELEQTVHFKFLLDQYFIMMQSVLPLITIQTDMIPYYVSMLYEGGKVSTVNMAKLCSPGYSHIDPSRMNTKELKRQSYPSELFNVSSSLILSTGNLQYSRTWPVTLEDYFTLFHQNIEAIISSEKRIIGIPEAKLPKELHSYLSKLTFSITSIQILNGKIEIRGSQALRSHAVEILITYDLEKKWISTQLDYVGGNEYFRWEFTAALAASLGADIPHLKIERPKIPTLTPLSVTIKFHDQGLTETQKMTLSNFIKAINDFTMSSYHPEDYYDALKVAREAFGVSPSPPFSLRDIENGGLMLAPYAIFKSLEDTNYERAEKILQTVEEFRKIQAHPIVITPYGTVKIIFFPDGDSDLDKSLVKLRKKLTVAIAPAAPEQDKIKTPSKILDAQESFTAIKSTESALTALEKDFLLITTIDPSLFTIDFFLTALSFCNPTNMAYKRILIDLYNSQTVSEDVLYNTDVLMRALLLSPLIYKSLPDRLKNDPKLLLIACNSHKYYLNFASETLRTDESILRQIDNQIIRSQRAARNEIVPNPQFAFTKMYSYYDRTDIEIAKIAIEYYPPDIFNFSAEIQANPEIVSLAASHDPSILDRIDRVFLENPTVAIASGIARPESLLKFSEAIRSNKEIILAIIRKCPVALIYADESIQHDPDLLAVAWHFNK